MLSLSVFQPMKVTGDILFIQPISIANRPFTRAMQSLNISAKKGFVVTTASSTTNAEMFAVMPESDWSKWAGPVVYSSVGLVLLLVIAGPIAFVCIKRKLRRRDKLHAENSKNPYHLADYGLRKFVSADELEVNKIQYKGFQSSNFRVVKDGLTERLAQINGILPGR